MAIPIIASVLTKATTTAEKTASVADKLRMEIGKSDHSINNLREVNKLGSKFELSDAALHTRVEASAHSACRFFDLPDILVQEGDEICVYRGHDIFPNKDVFEYNLQQFKQMGCTSFEDMSKVWAHECGHRLLRMDYPSPWAQELGADFFAGVRSQMLGLPTSNFEKFLGKTSGSLSHPPGELRLQAINYGREVVKDILAKGQTPTLDSCKDAFANSSFAKMQSMHRDYYDNAAFVDSQTLANAWYCPKSDGSWIDKRGNSKWVPDDDFTPQKNNPENKTWSAIKREHSIDGIDFKEGEPNFSEISKGDVTLDQKETDRGIVFNEADTKLAEQRGCNPYEVTRWRKENGYTWHETSDGLRVQKVPSIIHGNISHSGGHSSNLKSL